MCNKKTNKEKLIVAEKKFVDGGISEAIRENNKQKPHWKLQIIIDKFKKAEDKI